MPVPHRLCQIPLHMAFYRYNTFVNRFTLTTFDGGEAYEAAVAKGCPVGVCLWRAGSGCSKLSWHL